MRAMPDESSIPLEATVLTIHIDNRNPVELIDLTNSFLSLGEEYKRFAANHPEYGDSPSVRLYIKEIKTGSIIADLVAIAAIGSQTLLPTLGQANTVIGFSRHLKAAYDYFTGKSNEKPELNKTGYGHFSSIVEPIAKDNGSQVNFITTVNQTVVQTFNITSPDANAAQNSIGRELLQLKEPERKPHHKVVLYWFQARDDTHSKAGDRGIIESISSSSIKIEFEEDAIKEAMLHGLENPFRSAYVVDVNVETINDRPVLYKIIRYHSRFDKPEVESEEAH